jgi:hypothetical protein
MHRPLGLAGGAGGRIERTQTRNGLEADSGVRPVVGGVAWKDLGSGRGPKV